MLTETKNLKRHYYIINDDITKTKLNTKDDLITCVSVLEHIENHKDAVQSMSSLLEQNGHLIITCQYNEHKYVENVYELSGSSYGQNAPYITQSFSREEVFDWLEVGQFEIVE